MLDIEKYTVAELPGVFSCLCIQDSDLRSGACAKDRPGDLLTNFARKRVLLSFACLCIRIRGKVVQQPGMDLVRINELDYVHNNV